MSIESSLAIYISSSVGISPPSNFFKLSLSLLRKYEILSFSYHLIAVLPSCCVARHHPLRFALPPPFLQLLTNTTHVLYLPGSHHTYTPTRTDIFTHRGEKCLNASRPLGARSKQINAILQPVPLVSSFLFQKIKKKLFSKKLSQSSTTACRSPPECAHPTISRRKEEAPASAHPPRSCCASADSEQRPPFLALPAVMIASSSRSGRPPTIPLSPLIITIIAVRSTPPPRRHLRRRRAKQRGRW